MRLRDVPVPDTDVARRAADLLARTSGPSLTNHGLRSYLFAASLAALEHRDVDHELLYVASALHDLGLVPAYDNVALPFEEASATATGAFAAGAGWDEGRAARAAEAIVDHMRTSDPARNVEGYLLDVATGLDISGRGLERWPEALVADVLDAHPRLDIAAEFTALVTDQARRKPASAAADAVAAGIVERIAANPLDR